LPFDNAVKSRPRCFGYVKKNEGPAIHRGRTIAACVSSINCCTPVCDGSALSSDFQSGLRYFVEKPLTTGRLDTFYLCEIRNVFLRWATRRSYSCQRWRATTAWSLAHDPGCGRWERLFLFRVRAPRQRGPETDRVLRSQI